MTVSQDDPQLPTDNLMGKRNHIDSVKNKYMYIPLLMEKPHGTNPLHKTVTQLPTYERIPVMQEGQYLTSVLMPFYM